MDPERPGATANNDTESVWSVIRCLARRTESMRLYNVLRRIQEKEAPYSTYAQMLIALPNATSATLDGMAETTTDAPRISPLIRTSVHSQGSGCYLSARKNYLPAGFLAAGIPTKELFAGYSFAASAGTHMTQVEFTRKYHTLPTGIREGLRFLGKTLAGETVYGVDISEQRIGAPNPNLTTVKRAQAYERSVDETLQRADQILALLRLSLTDATLNPQGGADAQDTLRHISASAVVRIPT